MIEDRPPAPWIAVHGLIRRDVSIDGWFDLQFMQAALKQLGLEDDHWLPSRSDFYRYALTEEKLDGILFSPTQVEHLHQIAGALEKGPLQPEEIEYLETLSLHVHSPPSTDPSVST